MPTDKEIEPNDNGSKFQKQLEVYKQLHETCRHHYRLEWQLLQVGVIAAIGMLTFGFRNVNWDLRSWLFIGSGVALVWISYAMYRQSKGYLQANEHLVFYARLIGDPNVRKPGAGWKSAAVQGRVILFLVGAVLFSIGVWNANCIPCWIPRLPLILKILAISAMIVECGLWIAWQVLKTNCRTRWVSTSTLWMLGTTVTLMAIIVITCLVHHN